MSLSKKLQARLAETYPGLGRGEYTNPTQGSSEPNPETEIGQVGSGVSDAKSNGEVKLTAKSGAREETPHKQGSSDANPEFDEQDKDTPAKTTAKKVKKSPVPTGHGAGATPNATTVTDTQSVINQPSSKGNVHQEGVDPDLDFISEEDYDALSDEEKAEWVEVTGERMIRREDITLNFDPAVLFEGDDTLTDEFKAKATAIFEAVLGAYATEIREQIEDEVIQEVTETLDEYVNDLAEAADLYFTEAVNEWIAENEVALEQSIKADIAESFMDGVRTLFQEHNIDLSDETVDALEEMQAHIDELEAALEEQNEVIEEMHDQLTISERESILDEVSEGLAMTQADRLKTITEHVRFTDAETFKAQITAIRESIFDSKPEGNVEPLNEGNEEPTKIEETKNPISTIASIIPRPAKR